jgi:hypothetical protein
MAKNHGAKDQKRAAKQKAKRQAKRSSHFQRTSKDPTVRLQHAGKWQVVQAVVGDKLWTEGIGHVLIARRDSEGELVFAVFLVDVYCLGVKNAFWLAGTAADIEDVITKAARFETMRPTTPACLAKIVQGAVEYAQSFGFPPHPDYRHASMLLAGIDPSTCPNEFTFGRDGRPFYVQGPHESRAQADAIMRIVRDAGGHFIINVSGHDTWINSEVDHDVDPFESRDEEGSPDESP